MKKKASGFSIVELILYIGLLSTLLFIMTGIFVDFLQVRLESAANTAIQQDGDFILSRLFYDISRAETILTPSSDGTITENLVIRINSVDFTYNLNNGQLNLTNNFGTDSLNGEGTTVSNLSFHRIGNNSTRSTIKLSFTLTSNTRRNKGFDAKDFDTTVALRN